MGRNIISFELRPVKDDDIEQKLKDAVAGDITQSDIIRTALRHYFNLVLHTSSPMPSQNIPHPHNKHTPLFEPQDISVELHKKEKDDTQLDAAIDDLLKF